MKIRINDPAIAGSTLWVKILNTGEVLVDGQPASDDVAVATAEALRSRAETIDVVADLVCKQADYARHIRAIRNNEPNEPNEPNVAQKDVFTLIEEEIESILKSLGQL